MAEDLEDLLARLIPPRKPSKSQAEIAAGETEIVSGMKDVRYVVREYPLEVLVIKYLNGIQKDKNEVFVPDYQRDLIWPQKNQSRFIESLLVGLPIPFLFVADADDEDDPDQAGRLEIVDGVQRIRTLTNFLSGDLILSNMERLKSLNGFTFFDLHPARQRRFRRVTLRVIELTEGIGEDVRRDIFDRINSGSVGLEAVEVRRGMSPGPFVDLTTELADGALLRRLAPISDALKKRFEYEELITRFFAFMDRYQQYGTGTDGKVVKNFLLTYVKDMNEELSSPQHGEAKAASMRGEWSAMLGFVDRYIPNGFCKSGRGGRKVPRVRFEAIAVGVGLALRSNQTLDVDGIKSWIDSTEFKDWITSDAANNRVNVRGRIEFVRNRLAK